MTHPRADVIAVRRATVHAQRLAVAEARRDDGGDRTRLITTQRRLLAALEDFVWELRLAGVSPQHQLIAEIELLRRVTALGRQKRYRTGRAAADADGAAQR
jgi:hypothetical protein